MPRTARNDITHSGGTPTCRCGESPNCSSHYCRDEWITEEARAPWRSLAAAAWEGYLHDAVVRESAGVYSFELFTKRSARPFWQRLTTTTRGLPVRRPNSMNNYGLIVNEIGMRTPSQSCSKRYCGPWRDSCGLSSRHASTHTIHFIVRYKSDEDPGLDMHTDDSDVTFNACLNSNFTGRWTNVLRRRGHLAT